MRVLILSNSNPYNDAGIVAKDLLESLNNTANINATLLVRNWGRYKDVNIISFESPIVHAFHWLIRKIINSLLRRIGIKPTILQKCDPDYKVQDYFQTRTVYRTGRILNKVEFNPDAIIVMFMQKFLSFKNLYELNYITKAPVLLYMMDMAPMTGLCHYAWNCNGFSNICGECPALYSTTSLDQSRINLLFKKENVDKTNIIPVAASEWQYRQLDNSSLFKGKSKYKVLLSINAYQYCIADKDEVRYKLGLPKDKKILFFRVVSYSDKRKGTRELVETLKVLSENVPDPSLIHLAIAAKSLKEVKDLLPFSYTLLPELTLSNLHLAYQAADVFISPSIEDSGPMMINQAIMCGTPVAAFEMGVTLDLVINGETGYRAILGDTAGLAKGIQLILEMKDSGYREMSLKCRETGLRLCQQDLKGKEIVEIINKHLL